MINAGVLGALIVDYLNSGHSPEEIVVLVRANLENSGVKIKDGFDDAILKFINKKIERQKDKDEKQN